MNGANAPAGRTRIKICGLTREQDVDAAAAAGADAVGFVLYARSPRFVTRERAAALARRLPPFVTPVLLFVNEEPLSVRTACELVPGATVQFHGDETPEQCLAATSGGRHPFIRVARLDLDGTAPFDLLEFAARYPQARAILIDAHVEGYGGGGKAFDWSRIQVPHLGAPSAPTAAGLPHVVLSGGLNAANVTDGIGQVRPRCRTLAVDVSSGVELDGPGHQGLKDPEKIHRFVAAVRAADTLFAQGL